MKKNEGKENPEFGSNLYKCNFKKYDHLPHN